MGTLEKKDTEISFSLSIPRMGDILVSDSSFYTIDCSDTEPYSFRIKDEEIEGKFEQRGDKYYLCLSEAKEYPLKFGFKLKV